MALPARVSREKRDNHGLFLSPCSSVYSMPPWLTLHIKKPSGNQIPQGFKINHNFCHSFTAGSGSLSLRYFSIKKSIISAIPPKMEAMEK